MSCRRCGELARRGSPPFAQSYVGLRRLSQPTDLRACGMRKAERLFQLVNIIRVHQPITAASLADRLGVSVRSIYRYMDDLSLSGIPVYGEPGVGYFVHNDFTLPPLNLSTDEFEALTLAVSMLSRASGASLSAAAKSLLNKVECAANTKLPEAERCSIRSLAAPYSAKQMRQWDRLRTAISTKRVTHIAYTSLQGVTSLRLVLPLGLFYWGGKWTLGTWCTLRGAFRDFRVDLMDEVQVTPEHFSDSQASLSGYLAYHAQTSKAD